MSRESFARTFNQLERVVCTVTLVGFVTLIFAQIVSRQLFGYSLAWTEELSVYLFVWFAYFGASFAALHFAHNRVTFQLKRLSRRTAVLLLLVADGCWLLFTMAVIVVSADFVLFKSLPYWESQTLGVPMRWVYLVIPVSFLMMALRIVQAAVIRVRSGVEQPFAVALSLSGADDGDESSQRGSAP